MVFVKRYLVEIQRVFAFIVAVRYAYKRLSFYKEPVYCQLAGCDVVYGNVFGRIFCCLQSYLCIHLVSVCWLYQASLFCYKLIIPEFWVDVSM